MRVPADRRVPDMLEDLHINLYKTRREHMRRQASRSLGAEKHPVGFEGEQYGAQGSGARQSRGTFGAVPEIRGGVSVRASDPMPGLYIAGVSLLILGGLMALIGGIAVWRWIAAT